MDVALEVEANGGAPVPEVVGAAGYRIVQEALTTSRATHGPQARRIVRPVAPRRRRRGRGCATTPRRPLAPWRRAAA